MEQVFHTTKMLGFIKLCCNLCYITSVEKVFPLHEEIKRRMELTDYINHGASIIDVRTPGEFMGGSVTGAINIPLNEITERIEEIKKMQTPLIFCCLSGARSGQATDFCNGLGIESINGGPWQNVNYAKAQLF